MTRDHAHLMLVVATAFMVTSCAGNEVTVYRAYSFDDPEAVQGGLAGHPVNYPITYAVFPSSQTVVYSRSQVDEIPRSLAGCSVRNRLNWQCKFSDGSGTLTMTDGHFSQVPNPFGSRSVSRWEWWWLHVFPQRSPGQR